MVAQLQPVPWPLNISQVPQMVLQGVSPGAFDYVSQSLRSTLDASKMMLSKLVPTLFWAALTVNGLVETTATPQPMNPVIKAYDDAPLQDIVTWDEHSVFVRGERIMLFNGEFHPYRLPVTSLWLDIFQKLKAAGFSGVSFYTDWYLSADCPSVDGI